MIEKIWGWVEMTNKFTGSCRICHVEIPEGDNVKWKQGIGIVHPECIDKAKELENLKDQALAKYHLGQYDEAERCARQCIENTKVLLESETQRNEGWFLVRKNLNNIKDSEKARVILEELLLGIEI